MKKTIRVFLVDDHQVVKDGLRALLSDENSILVCGESNGSDINMNLLKKLNPDIVLMDISLGKLSGLDLTLFLLQELPILKVIVLSVFNDRESIYKAVEAGAAGYLTKCSERDEIICAVKQVFDGQKFFSREITDIMIDELLEQRKLKDTNNDKESIECLSPRELHILQLFAGGYTNSEIAEQLKISIRTVESHKTHVMQKLGYKTVVDLVKFAIRNNIADVN